MSGGTFNYGQHHIHQIVDDVKQAIDNNTEYDAETIALMRAGVKSLMLAYEYAHHIDYLLTGDNDEKSFKKYLKQDLKKVETEYGGIKG